MKKVYRHPYYSGECIPRIKAMSKEKAFTTIETMIKKAICESELEFLAFHLDYCEIGRKFTEEEKEMLFAIGNAKCETLYK